MRYCCDELCNQGRDCPARVAKIGQRYPKYPTPLRESSQKYLRATARFFLLAILGWLIWVPLFYLLFRE